MTGVRIPLGTGLFIFAMAFGTYPRNGYQGLFAGIKFSERDADHSPTYSAEVNNACKLLPYAVHVFISR